AGHHHVRPRHPCPGRPAGAPRARRRRRGLDRRAEPGGRVHAPRAQRGAGGLSPHRRRPTPHPARRHRQHAPLREAGRRAARGRRVAGVHPRRRAPAVRHRPGAGVRGDRRARRAVGPVRHLEEQQPRDAHGVVPPPHCALLPWRHRPRPQPAHHADVHGDARHRGRDGRRGRAARDARVPGPRHARRRARPERHGGAHGRRDPDRAHPRERARAAEARVLHGRGAAVRRRARQDRLARRDARARHDGRAPDRRRAGSPAPQLHRGDPRGRARLLGHGPGSAPGAVRHDARGRLQPDARGRAHPDLEARPRVHGEEPGARRGDRELRRGRGDDQQQGHRPLPPPWGEVRRGAQLVRADRRRARGRRADRAGRDDLDRARQLLARGAKPGRHVRAVALALGARGVRLARRLHRERVLPLAGVHADDDRARHHLHGGDDARVPSARARRRAG
ncbi:MAG: hypothetical protein AVDCRST_MAG69-2155, partial [uncultured Solirubrobacteraceae bacterium]